MSDGVLEHRIEELIERLSSPPSASEIRDGWTAKSKVAMKDLLVDLLAKFRSGQSLPPLSISRGMDTWGVTGGDLFEEAAKISNELRSLGTRKET
jgi:hypothetical protein